MNSFWKSFRHAFEGILYLSKGPNARVQIMAAATAIMAAIISNQKFSIGLKISLYGLTVNVRLYSNAS
jgi:diacylglycerol kinase